jgi:hypothetical protein
MKNARRIQCGTRNGFHASRDGLRRAKPVYAHAILWVGATALLFGCTAGTKATTGAAGTSGTGSGGMTGTAGTSAGATTGTAGTGTGFDANFDLSGGDHPGDGVCSATMTAAEPVPLDLYVLMDSSLSMNDSPTTTAPPKWTTVRSAMKTFFESQSSAGLGVGLKYFPGVQSGAMPTCTMDGADPTACGAYGPCDRRKTCVGNSASTPQVLPLCGVPGATTTCNATTEACAFVQQCGTAPNYTYCAKGATAAATECMGCTTFNGYCHLRDRCDAAYYATPDVAVAALDGTTGGQAATLNASLNAHNPAGYTPTGPALTGALMFARQRIASMPTHRVAVVLVTDGLPGGFLTGIPPTECTPADVAGISTLLSGAMGTSGAPPVNTFVIGMFSPGMAADTARTNLDALATAGGTSPAVIIDTSQDVAAALQNAFKQVQSKAIACDFKIPSTGVDFKQVNVQFTSGSGSATPILHAPPDGAGGCDARGGWYYDKDPASGTPTKITACPTTCSMFQTDLNGHVDVILGCPTIDVN